MDEREETSLRVCKYIQVIIPAILFSNIVFIVCACYFVTLSQIIPSIEKVTCCSRVATEWHCHSQPLPFGKTHQDSPSKLIFVLDFVSAIVD